jgi:hypothetical protein
VFGMTDGGGEDEVLDRAERFGLGFAGHGMIRSWRQRGAVTERTPRVAVGQRGRTGLRIISLSRPQQCVFPRHSPG